METLPTKHIDSIRETADENLFIAACSNGQAVLFDATTREVVAECPSLADAHRKAATYSTTRTTKRADGVTVTRTKMEG